VPPTQRRGDRVPQTIKESLDVLSSRVVQHRPGQRAFPMKFDLRRPMGPGRIQNGTVLLLVVVQPDENTAIVSDAQMPGRGEGFEIAGLADDADGDQRPGGGEAFTGHDGEPDPCG
jgi:hypothetical protein